MAAQREAFVIMPVSGTKTCSAKEWEHTYQHLFKPALEGCGLRCDKAKPTTGNLIDSIVEKLRSSWLALADTTDMNPNVFYELGVRHSLSGRTIIVSRDSDSIPSDLRGYWSVTYGTDLAAAAEFKLKIKEICSQIEANPDKSDNPVSDYLERERLSVAGYVQTENIKKLGALHTEFTGNLLALDELEQSSDISGYGLLLSNECLKLLLQTLYIDLGPELLKDAHRLLIELRLIDSRRLDAALLDSTRARLLRLSEGVWSVRNGLLSGEYEEPSVISTMVWTSAEAHLDEAVPDDAVAHTGGERSCPFLCPSCIEAKGMKHGSREEPPQPATPPMDLPSHLRRHAPHGARRKPRTRLGQERRVSLPQRASRKPTRRRRGTARKR